MVAAIERLLGSQSYELGGSNIAFIPNVSSGILGAWYPGISTLTIGSAAALAKMSKNYWTGTGGNLSGTFNPQPAYLGFGADEYLDTLLAEQQNVTFMAICNVTPGVTGQVMGNYVQTGASFAALTFVPPSPVSGNTGFYQMVGAFSNGGTYTSVSAQVPTTAYTDVTQWKLMVGRITAGVSVDLWDLTTGSGNPRKTTATALPRTLPASGTIRLGSPVTASYQKPVNICTARYYGIALSDAQVQSEAALMRTYAANRGITV